ncbi:AAA family ATPase [Flammeovirgaceae bacterium SG7u.111]|nr:AAA family ATPase [Flammeovirgaceae bacterium SG7u.132]WPO34622.1 AAA family ATPase [Flammeovirgaceae bacterium SG7u.111]
MESRIFPNWGELNELNNPLTEGEKTLLTYLDKYLPVDRRWTKDQPLTDYDGWLIFAQPFLNGTRPDIIIFNPFVGIVIYEVKDWKNLDSVKDYNSLSPLRQVEHYKEKIIGQLIPHMGEVIDSNPKNYGLIKTALYFHKVSTKDAQDAFEKKIKGFDYFPVFGFDFLHEERLNQIVPDVHITKSRFWNRSWNKDLFYWLKPPFHSKDDGVFLNLSKNQKVIARPKEGHHRARGVAGSGKTLALAWRAAQLASMGKNVLIISYNITLWHYIRDMVMRTPFDFYTNYITYNHFHGFCKDVLYSLGEKWPNSSNAEESEEEKKYFFKTVVPEYVRAVLMKRGRQRLVKYDAILIDEGQDYHLDWYQLLNDHFLTSRDELLVVLDKKQNIYERKLDWLDKRSNSNFLKKFEDKYIDLSTSYRMPSQVQNLAVRFSEDFDMDQSLQMRKVEMTMQVGFNNVDSPHIIWLNIMEGEWEGYIKNAFLRLKRESEHPSDMVFLIPNKEIGTDAVRLFGENYNIEANHVFDRKHKKSFWMGDGRLKISTIHSFKGWELRNIVLLIPEAGHESLRKLDSMVYTAITRTRQNLIVINANPRYKDFGEGYPKHWHKQDQSLFA